MNILLKSLIASVATLFGFGLAVAAVSSGSLAADDVGKRDEDSPELVLVADDDDDDGGDDSGDSRDGTNSQFSAVSRDGERSRGDLTRDRTRDGAGGPKRDWSDNRTNDRSRADSRASRKTGDGTRSNYSRISRDGERSRADLTRDRTRDGAGVNRDFSQNLTNDRSRNDTR
jgi:hypothetical protein